MSPRLRGIVDIRIRSITSLFKQLKIPLRRDMVLMRGLLNNDQLIYRSRLKVVQLS